MTLQEWEEQKDAELEQQVSALFRSADKPRPSSRFVSRTITALRAVPLPAGRRALRRSWVTPAGWAILIAAATAIVAIVAVYQPLVGAVFARLLSTGIRTGFWLIQMTHTSVAVFGVFATTAGVVAKALSTRDATIALMLLMAISALSLSMLNRLLFSQKESSSW